MQRPSSKVESTGIDQREASLSGRNGRQLGEANVIANRHGYLAVLGEVHNSKLIPRRQDVRLGESDPARDVNVEKVDFPVRGEEFSLGGEDEGGVVVFLLVVVVVNDKLGDGAADEVDFVVAGDVLEGEEGWVEVRGGVGGVGGEGLGVGGKVVGAVGGVEALGEDDDFGRGGFDGRGDGGGGVGEVVGFGGCGGELDAG